LIFRAIKTSRLSAAKLDGGGWLIDPAEFARVFPADRAAHREMEQSVMGNGTALIEHQAATIADLRGTLRDLLAKLGMRVLRIQIRPYWAKNLDCGLLRGDVSRVNGHFI
jgi:hypothetical protein